LKMALKTIALCVVLSLTFSYGAVVPLQEDALFDMLQSFLIQPDEFATSLGMTRVKRSAFDKEFKFDALGLQIQIKYLDPNNQLKGGQAVITIDNLKRFIKRARSTKVKLTINFDSGATPRDGLFKMSIDYELHHANLEKGTLNVERRMDGGMWKTDVSITSSKPGVQLIPGFVMSLKSDRRTMMEGTVSSQDGHKYDIKADRVPGKKVHAVITGAGKTYTIDGVVDQAQKSAQITIDANGLKYKIDLDMDDSGDAYKFKADLNLGRAGTYNVEWDGKKDMTSSSAKVLFNGRNFASVKMMGKVDPAAQNFKYEVRYSIVGAGDGKLRLSMKGGDTKEMKVQYLPNNGLDLKIKITRELHSDASRHIQAEVTRGGEKYLEYKNDIIPTNNPDSYELKVDSQFDMSEKSMLYPVFCNYGCFKTRTMHAKLFVQKDKAYKFSLDVELTKDGNKVLNMEINSRNNPYVLKIVAPRILPKILPTGRESIEFEADHNPGNYLRIKSNTNILKSFKIEKIDGNMRRVELNGKELVKAGLSQADNSISQTTTLPDGRSLTTTISWQTDNLYRNKVNFKLDSTERKLNADLDWDINPNIAMKVDAKGENARWGKYALMRDIKVSTSRSKFNAEWVGHSTFPNAPWPSPVSTEVKASVDTRSRDYTFMVKKAVAGSTYGLTLQNGRLSVNL